MVLDQLNGPADDLHVVSRHGPKCSDHLRVGREPVDGLPAGLEVLDHGVEALGGGEVRVRHVHAVDHDGHLAVALLHGGLADQVPHVGDGREDNTLVGGDADVVLVNSRYLKQIQRFNLCKAEG